MKSTLNKQLQATSRRGMMRLAAGSAVGLVLAACGGGGGGSDTPTQREAFDRLQPGMTKKQVYELVRRTPSDASNTNYIYHDNSENLHVSFSGDNSKAPDDFVLRDATWDVINGKSITRGYL